MKAYFSFAAVLAFALLMGCNDESPPLDSTRDEPPKPEVSTVDPPPEQTSLFSPVSAAHQKSMEERKEEAAEIERRIEAAAKAQEAEFLQEVEAKLKEYHEQFAGLHADQIQPSVDQYEADLKVKYLETLRQNYDAAQAGGMTVLAQQIAEEGKRVKAGEPVPGPPAATDQANPGMQLLFDLRRWYHEGLTNIAKSSQSSEVSLTENYRSTLTQYHEYVSQISPPEAGEKVIRALEAIEGSWWESENESETPATKGS